MLTEHKRQRLVSECFQALNMLFTTAATRWLCLCVGEMKQFKINSSPLLDMVV